MKTLKIAAGIAVFFTLLCTPATTQSAAFRNGGFEQDLTGWKSSTFGNYTLPVISVEKSAAPEGSTAVKLTASDGNTRGWVEQRFAVQGGAAYIIEGNLKAANVTHNRFGIQVIEYPADSDAALTLDIKKTLPIQITKNTQDWTPYRAAVQTAPETATITVRVYLGTHGPVQKSAEAWADGITVTEQASGTAFNLLQNGSFEHKSVGNNAVWQGGSEPAQWTLWTAKGTAGVTAAFDTAEKQDGAQSVRIGMPSKSRLSLHTTVPIDSAKRYRFSAALKTENIEGSVYVRMVYLGADGKQLPGKLPTTHIVHGATPWTDYRIQLSPPQDAAKLKIECFADDASGTVWFDACSLTEEAGR
nr:DUF642 domain-containing protein [uncultured Treponema sp.]